MNFTKLQPNTELNINDRNRLMLYPAADTSLVYDDSPYTRFLLVSNGTLKFKHGLISGCFSASINSPFEFQGTGIIIDTPGYIMQEEAFCTVKPNKPGNLSYIDGCSNSNLVNPPRNGDPCTNYLYFPENISQTFHTHPSCRIGIVLSGSGEAHIGADKILDLKQGDMFVLDRHVLHRFKTHESTMSLMVFHPDSDGGPVDEMNPMKTRTLIGLPKHV